jgi:hypothetical protein
LPSGPWKTCIDRTVRDDDVKVEQFPADCRLGDQSLQCLLPNPAPQVGRGLLALRQVTGFLRHCPLKFRLESRHLDRLAADFGDPARWSHQPEKIAADPPADKRDSHQDEEPPSDPGISVAAELRDHETRRVRILEWRGAYTAAFTP